MDTCLVICEEEVDHAKQLQYSLLRPTSVHLVVIQDKVRVDLEREQRYNHHIPSYQAGFAVTVGHRTYSRQSCNVSGELSGQTYDLSGHK